MTTLISEKTKNFLRKKELISFFSLLLFFTFNANAQSERTNNPVHIQGIIGHQLPVIAGKKLADIPKEQLIKEAIFFHGDSLNGFDFDAASAQIKKDGFNMYEEFLAVMHRTQAGFVQKKYNLAQLPHQPSQKQYTPPSVLASSCQNLDFEDGNLGGWTVTAGYNTNSNGNLTTWAAGATSTNQDIYSCSYVNLITGAYGNDPIGFPGKDPSGGSYSARVGGFNRNVADGYGFGCTHINFGSLSDGEILERTYSINASNNLLAYDYAVVLNDGGHSNGNQPYFHVFVKDLAGNLLSTCTEYYVQAAAGGPPAGFTNSGYVNTYDNSVFYYKNWTSNSINLSAWNGQTVKVSFVAAGCTGGAHPGWAYVDATCAAAQLIAANLSPCQGSTDVLTAPPVQGGSYSWSGPGIVGSTTGQSVTVNASGVYSCTIVPSQGAACAYSLSITVTFDNPTSSLGSSTNVSCNGGNNGSATVSPSGGSPAYTYAWSPSGGNAATANNLTAGSYNCTVTDSKGCTTVTSVTISQPTVLNASLSSQTNVSCNGGTNGSATVNPSGGTPNYTYSWSPSGGNAATANNLGAGSYNCTVTDSHGCTKVVPVTITQPTALNATASSTQTACSVNNGTATASPSSGTPNYTYSWSPSGGNAQTANNLAAGNYVVTVTDSKGCTKTASVTVTTTGGPSVSTTSSTPAGCSVNNGTASATGAGGTPNYTYLWTPSGQTTPTATGLAGGSYNIVITDANGCSAIATVNVPSTAAPNISSTSSSPAGCSVNNGTASATGSGGSPAYTYVWSNGQSTQTATGLSGGTYTITLTDANGCKATSTVSVSSTSAPTTAASSTQATCAQSNGTGTANPSGGTPAYTYNWTGGQVTQTATGLSPGNYSVVITDANGCTATASITISAANGPTVTASASSNVSCNGGSNGSANATTSGGTPAFTYQWSNGQTTQTATGLSAGSYNVTVTDANGCSYVAATSISQPSILGVTTSPTNISCNGGNTGSATANSTGGTPNYTYLWSDGQATQTATGLIAGTYSVLVTDANGCTSIATATISQATALSVAPSQTNVLCNGGSSGTATPNVSGGNPAYSYSWSNGQTNQTAIGLSIGSYTVVVTDSKGCTTNTVFNITEPTVLSNSVSQTNLTCFNVNNGSATATPSGGTPNYSYSWSPVGGNAATANNLGAGNYVVTVTDANGCTTTSSVTLTQPAQIISTYTATNVLCNGQNNGSATLTTNGGNPAYTYAWSPSGGNAATANNLGAGNYVVTVSDASGCTSTVNVNITQPNALAAPVSVITPKCNGQNNGSATATPSGGTSPYTYSWSTTPVQNTQTANNLSAGNYNVTVTDANGCSTQIPVQVTQPGPIMVNVSGNDSVCAGDSLLLSASVNGGTPAYTYAWSPTGSGQNIYVFPTTSTTYSVVTTDANGCSSVTQTFNVNIFPKPTAMFDTASGGMYSSTFNFTDSSTNASSYYWNFGDGTTSTQQNPVHNYTIAGTYTVTEVVFNQFGCPDTFKRVITFNEGILIPNVFTPDGDGVNDVWYIPNSGMKSFHVEIYNRWGEKVFETTADEIRWDGRSTSGQLLNDGTYYFTLKAFLRSPSGEKDYSTSGYVTLLTRRK